MKKITFILILILLPTSLIFSQSTISDVDGNTYRIANFGSQTWMIDNLKTTKFNDGTPLIEGKKKNWKYFYGVQSDVGQYAYYDFDIANDSIGAFYRFPMFLKGNNQIKNICPTGWKIPSAEDWKYLISVLGNTPESFNLFATGVATNDDFAPSYFIEQTFSTVWWSSTQNKKDKLKATVFAYIFKGQHKTEKIVELKGRYVFSGYCVRCIKE